MPRRTPSATKSVLSRRIRRAAALPLLSLAGTMLVAIAAAAAPPVKHSASEPRRITGDTLAADILSAMDPKADPCSDFYRYACGGWLDANSVPSDETRWARSFSTIDEANRVLLRRLVEDAARAPGDDPTRRRVGDFYAACMDEAAIEKAGTTPLASWFARIDAAKSGADLVELAGVLQARAPSPFFSLSVTPDFADPLLTIGTLGQGGLGLPERDYYVSDDPEQQKIRAAYEKHVARMFELAGSTPADAARDAAAVLAFETGLARAARPAVELRRSERLYHRLDRHGLEQLAPGIAWDRFFNGLGHDLQALNVETPETFVALDYLLQDTPLATQKAYLRWQVLDWSSNLLPKRFVDAAFDFYGRTLSGQEEQEPRWKRCVGSTSGALRDSVGQLYVAEAFAGTSRPVALEMVEDVLDAFESTLPQLAWMDDATREKARAKAATFLVQIGYPERWRDESTIKIDRTSHFANAWAASEASYTRFLNKVGGPVDRKDWAMPVQMVNAGYAPTMNRVTFPAGILQPPMFHAALPAAVNYGSIGTVIGHEVTHGFDDDGRKFDPDGRLADWWTPAAATAFGERAKCLVDQASAHEVLPGVHLDGQLTLGENLADAGGLRQSWLGYKAWETRHGKGPGVGKLNGDQLFFVAHAQTWCEESTEATARMLAKVDVHGAGPFRAIGPILNHPAFAAAFGCKAGAPMAPVNKCEIW